MGAEREKKADYHSDGWININDKYEWPYKQKFKLNLHPLDHTPSPQSLSIHQSGNTEFDDDFKKRKKGGQHRWRGHPAHWLLRC